VWLISKLPRSGLLPLCINSAPKETAPVPQSSIAIVPAADLTSTQEVLPP
jgi:hypothetical protein